MHACGPGCTAVAPTSRRRSSDWDAGQCDHLLQGLRIAMSQVESDGDPLFASIRRMWTRREPLLTRFDMSVGCVARRRDMGMK